VTHCLNNSTNTYCCGSNWYNYYTHICCSRYVCIGRICPSTVAETGKDESHKEESDNDKSFEPIPDEESDITEAPTADKVKPFNSDE